MFWKVLLFVIVIIYLLRLFTRYLLPFLLFNFIKKNAQQFQGFNQSREEFYRSDKKAGDVTVDFQKSNKKKKVRSDEGEYVDYEELK